MFYLEIYKRFISLFIFDIINMGDAMKEIIHNEDNLKQENINNVVKRAKVLIINSNDEFLLAKVNNDIHVVGGHVDKNETDQETIIREVKEETGIDIAFNEEKPFINIKYICKNYPKNNVNTLFSANYYIIKCDLKPDLNNTSLEPGEINGNFKLLYVHKDKAIDMLESSLEVCKNKNVVHDTIDVISEYLKSRN